MKDTLSIYRATKIDSGVISVLVGELLREIMDRIGIVAFNFDLEETTQRLEDFIINEKKYRFCGQRYKYG